MVQSIQYPGIARTFCPDVFQFFGPDETVVAELHADGRLTGDADAAMPIAQKMQDGAMKRAVLLALSIRDVRS